MTEIKVNDKVIINTPHFTKSLATVKQIGYSQHSNETYYIVETEEGCRTKCMKKHITKFEEVSRKYHEITIEQFDDAVLMLTDCESYRDSGVSDEAIEEMIESVMLGAGMLRHILFESEDDENV